MNQPIWLLVLEIFGSALAAAGFVYLLLMPRLAAAIESQKEAEQTRRLLMLEAKEEAARLRAQSEETAKASRDSLEKQAEKLESKEDALEQRRIVLEQREQSAIERFNDLNRRESELLKKHEEAEEQVRRMSGLDKEAAKEWVLSQIESEFREIGLRRAKEIESMTVAEAERKARHLLLGIMERSTIEYVTEATIAVVNLPTEDMKGRLIGREGRNIRAFEQVAGVDLIIDDTPEAVVISCFDPVRREIARLALMNLMLDGRIHPGRIEELYEKAQVEVNRMVQEAGERAAERAGVSGLNAKTIETMGRLRFRTSYAQNVLDHSVEVSAMAAMLASEMGLNAEVARRAGLLHDIGKALGPEWEGPHALTGMEFLRQQGEKEAVLLAVGAHHHEIEPTTPESVVIIVADGISAARPGARREGLDNYVKRLTALENLANSFPQVERSYALQAGREIRLIVRPEELDDLGAARLAGEVARRIEGELDYPGQIKVTVIRETRASEVAK